jgi:hypothetical protein
VRRWVIFGHKNFAIFISIYPSRDDLDSRRSIAFCVTVTVMGALSFAFYHYSTPLFMPIAAAWEEISPVMHMAWLWWATRPAG